MSLAALPAAGDIAFVTNQSDSSLSVLDLDTREERARWSVPGQPAGVAVTPDAVYTVAPEAKMVRRHDPQSGAVLAKAALDGGPTGIVADPSRGRIFVSDWYNARVWVLEAQTLSVAATLETGAAPAGLALAGSVLATADRDANQVSLFDARRLTLLNRVDVGLRPYGLAFAPDGRLFIANVGSNDVSVIEPETGKVVATLPVGERPYGIGFAAGRAFVTNQYAGTLSVIDLATLDPVATVGAGEYPEGIDATFADDLVVVANWFDNTVSLLDPKTLEMVGEIATGDGPRAFGRFIMATSP